MNYLGGKSKHSKEIVNVILSLSKNKTTWVEPFIGGGSVVTKVPKTFKIYGSDINSNVVELYKHVQKGGELPNEVTETQYKAVKQNPEAYSAWYIGLVSIGCSFGGKEWGGYARSKEADGSPVNFAARAKRKLFGMDFSEIHLETLSYSEVIVNNDCIVYCDPPYAGTTGYKTKFDSGSFWEWAEKSAKVADVYVSEYNAPQGWECIWEKETGSLAGKASVGKRATEKLFRLNKHEMAL